MSIELTLEKPAVDEPIGQLVQDLMEEHSEVLIIGVRPTRGDDPGGVRSTHGTHGDDDGDPVNWHDGDGDGRQEQRKHTLAVYIKAAENGGHLLPYLKDLVEELVQRYERAAEASTQTKPY